MIYNDWKMLNSLAFPSECSRRRGKRKIYKLQKTSPKERKRERFTNELNKVFMNDWKILNSLAFSSEFWKRREKSIRKRKKAQIAERERVSEK